MAGVATSANGLQIFPIVSQVRAIKSLLDMVDYVRRLDVALGFAVLTERVHREEPLAEIHPSLRQIKTLSLLFFKADRAWLPIGQSGNGLGHGQSKRGRGGHLTDWIYLILA